MKKLFLAFLIVLFLTGVSQAAKVAYVKTEKMNYQYLGDMLAIFEDDYQPSPTEFEIFNWLIINGTRAEVEARLDQITPTIAWAFQWESDGKYHFTEPEYPDVITDMIDVYQVEGGIKWYKLVNDFNFLINFEDLTPEEKQLLAIDINHPSVDSFIRKVVKDLALDPANQEEIQELKNQSPY